MRLSYPNPKYQFKPSTQLIDATSFIKTWDATIEAEESADISSYQMLSADKNWRSYINSTKLVEKRGVYVRQ